MAWVGACSHPSSCSGPSRCRSGCPRCAAGRAAGSAPGWCAGSARRPARPNTARSAKSRRSRTPRSPAAPADRVLVRLGAVLHRDGNRRPAPSQSNAASRARHCRVYHFTVLAEPLTSFVAELAGDSRRAAAAGWRSRVAPKPSEANAAGIRTRDVETRRIVGVDRDQAAVTVEGFEVPVIWSILLQQRLDAVGDVELVAGRARRHEGERGAVDGDGVAGGEAGAIESERAAPDSSVAPLIGAGGAALLLAPLPVAELSVLKKLSPAAIAGCRDQRGVGELRRSRCSARC